MAIKAYYHDPTGAPNQTISALALDYAFDPAPYSYWVILGYSDYVDAGIDGHDTFVLRRGTYYGGPSNYDPKDLNPEIIID